MNDHPSGATVCPRCGREAPLVYRGVVPYCTACGQIRAPLSGASVNLAGKPSRVGGTFAEVIGWLVLVVGGSIALGVGLLLAALGATGVGLALAIPIALVTLFLGIALVRSGRSLARSGTETEQATQAQALLEMAAHRGAVTARDAAQALGIGVAQADAMLTDLAKREPDRVAVDVDDQGVVWYRVARVPGEPLPRVRVEENPGAATVEAPGTETTADVLQDRRASRASR